MRCRGSATGLRRGGQLQPEAGKLDGSCQPLRLPSPSTASRPWSHRPGNRSRPDPPGAGRFDGPAEGAAGQTPCPPHATPGPAATSSAAGLHPSPSAPASVSLAPVAAAAAEPDAATAHPAATSGQPATPHGLPHFCHRRSLLPCLTCPAHRLHHPRAGPVGDSQYETYFKNQSRLLCWDARPPSSRACVTRPWLLTAAWWWSEARS